jgi:hypothetical protein
MRQQKFTQYYLIEAGLGASGIDGIGPVYSTPPFLQRWHGFGNILWGLFRAFRPHVWQAAKTVDVESLKTLGREALRAGTNIVHDIAQNPQSDPADIVGRHVSECTHNILRILRVGGRPRANNLTVHRFKWAGPHRAKWKSKEAVKGKRAPCKLKTKRQQTIKRDIFS